MLSTSPVPLVKRLRWLSVVTILAGAILTLTAQPLSYWQLPRTAIRFDGLPIHSATNPMFDLLLGTGWAAYLLTVAIFAAAAWLVPRALPTRIAAVPQLTLLFSLCYTQQNWIAVGWHGGMASGWLWACALGLAVSVALAPDLQQSRELARLRWIMALAIGIDGLFTLLGQPAAYWHNTAAVYEGNPASKYFLQIGWWAYVLYLLAEIALGWVVVVRYSRAALILLFGGFIGASNWLFYVWRLGLLTVILFAFLLSVAIVLMLRRNHASASPAARPAWLDLIACP